MVPSEAEVFLDALNRPGRAGTDVALLKSRLAAARSEVMGLKVELENARRLIAKQQGDIRLLDGLLQGVYSSRGWRLTNWLRCRLSVLRGLFKGGNREGGCDHGPADSQGNHDEAGARGPAVLPG